MQSDARNKPRQSVAVTVALLAIVCTCKARTSISTLQVEPTATGPSKVQPIISVLSEKPEDMNIVKRLMKDLE